MKEFILIFTHSAGHQFFIFRGASQFDFSRASKELNKGIVSCGNINFVNGLLLANELRPFD